MNLRLVFLLYRDFKVRLGYVVSLRLIWVIQRSFVLVENSFQDVLNIQNI